MIYILPLIVNSVFTVLFWYMVDSEILLKLNSDKMMMAENKF